MKYILFLGVLLFSIPAVAQQVVSGRVVDDATEQALPGVAVKTVDPDNILYTDADGKFRLTLRGNSGVLTFLKNGYQAYSYHWEGQAAAGLVIPLVKRIQDIDEVQLSTGYQQIPKERSTGSFTYIGQNLLKQQVSPNILDRIAEVSSSVMVDKGSSYAKDQISIRGLSTINGGRDPLIILDNFPYEGSISHINPNMVESVTILKDAAAASIWGAKAANGVIVITTKKGRPRQAPTLEFGTSTTIAGKPNLDQYRNISSSDFIDVERELFARGYYNSQISSSSKTVLSPVVELLNQQRNGLISAEEADRQISQFKTYDSKQQFLRYMYQPLANRQYFINMYGGTDTFSWITSAGYDDRTGNLGETYRKWNVNVQNTWKPMERLSIATGVMYTDARSMSGRTGYYDVAMKNNSAVPYMQMADSNGNALAVPKIYRQSYKESMAKYSLLDWNYYPLTDWQHNRLSSKTSEIILNAGLTYKVIRDLDVDVKYQYRQQNAEDRTDLDENSFYTRNYINSFAQILSDNSVKFIVPVGGIRNLSNSAARTQNLRSQLNYNHHWEKSYLTAIAGFELRNTTSGSSGNRYYGVDAHNLSVGAVDYVNMYPKLVNGSMEYIENGQSLGQKTTRFVSLYANTAYTLANQYTLSGSVRRDASNLFGLKTNDQWNPFWSAGMAWDISKAAFYQLAALPYLKVRATYGFNGNINTAMAAVTTLKYDGVNSSYTNQPTAYMNNYYNPQLKWETSRMLNLGIDFSAFNNRFSGSIEYFKKKGTDLFGPKLLDYTTGIADMTANVAETTGHGFDLTFSTININKKLRWQSTLNLSTFKDEVLSYYIANPLAAQFIGNGSSVPIAGIVGRPVYSIFAYQWGGLDPATGDPVGYLNGEKSRDYTSIVGTGTTMGDLKYFGSALPTVYGSFLNSCTFEHWGLDVALSYKLGYWFRRSSISYTDLFSSWKGHSDYALRWQKPGDELITDVPSNPYKANANRDAFYQGSEVLVERGDHIRLQYINLYYKWTGDKLTKKDLPFRDWTISLNVSNIGLLWRANHKGIDPDYNLTGSALRAPAYYTFGIQTKF